MGIIVRVLFWVTLLAAGVKAVSIITLETDAGSGNGAGVFSYSFRSHFDSGLPTRHLGQLFGRVTIEGGAPSRFKSYGGVSPVYDQVTLHWYVHGDEISERKTEVNLQANEIDADGRSVALSASSLAEIFGIEDLSPRPIILSALMDFLNDCRTGELPRPAHHPYQFDHPLRWEMQHVAVGNRVRYSVIGWIGVWLGLLIAIYLIPWLVRRLRRVPNNQ